MFYCKQKAVLLMKDGLYCGGIELIFVFVPEEIFFRRIVGPNIFDAFIDIALILNLLKIFQYF